MHNEAHCIYVRRMVKELRKLASEKPDAARRIRQLHKEVLVLAMLDLEPARKILEAAYSNRVGGRPPRDPVNMLRSVILMLLRNETSYNK